MTTQILGFNGIEFTKKWVCKIKFKLLSLFLKPKCISKQRMFKVRGYGHQKEDLCSTHHILMTGLWSTCDQLLIVWMYSQFFPPGYEVNKFKKPLWINCCAFQTAFGCVQHLKAGRNTQQSISLFNMSVSYWHSSWDLPLVIHFQLYLLI